MNTIRLGPLPKTELVKIVISLPVQLKTDLERYAAIHSETHGEKVDVAAIVPHMLDAFIARDRAFQRVRKSVGAERHSA